MDSVEVIVKMLEKAENGSLPYSKEHAAKLIVGLIKTDVMLDQAKEMSKGL